MIHIEFQQPVSEIWKKWVRDARQATDHLIRRGPPYSINESLYKKQRDELFAAYYDKCAYCEGDYALVMKGQVEHYRPKGAVKHADGTTVMIKVGGKDVAHPGYYWLAYDYNNLLPACSLCNSHFKRDVFPVVGGHASSPGGEADESPLLLHPRFCDPETEFVFSPKTGILGPRTDVQGTVNERAKVSIDVYKLNREGLPRARSNAYNQVRYALNTVMMKYDDPEELAEALQTISGHRSGRAPYALAGRRALEDLRRPIAGLFETLKPIFNL